MDKNTMQINKNLKKFRIPFWVVFAVLMALEITQSVFRGLSYPLTIFLFVIGIAYVLIGLGCIIYYYITGVKLQRMRRKMKVEASAGRARRLNKVSEELECQNCQNVTKRQSLHYV
jgi:hypothetical protein